MSFGITLKDVQFTKFVDVLVAQGNIVLNGLRLEYYHGVNQTQSSDNTVATEPDGTVVGSPTYTDFTGTYDRQNYIDTGISGNTVDSLSFLTLCKPNPVLDDITQLSLPINNFVASIPVGFTSNASITNLTRIDGVWVARVYLQTGTNTAAELDLPIGFTPNLNAFYFVSATYDHLAREVIIYLIDTVHGVVSQTFAVGGTHTTAGNNFVVGDANNSAAFDQPFEIAYSSLYNRPLLTNEITDAYDFLKGYYANKILMA